MADNEKTIWRSVAMIALLTTIIFGFIVVFVIARLITISKKYAAYSQVASIYAYLNDLNIKDTKELGMIFDANGRCLNEMEYSSLTAKMWQARVIDTGGRARSEEDLLLDIWNQRILIAGRLASEETLEFVVWSKGLDRISGTDDDIVYDRDTHGLFFNKVKNKCQ